MTKKTLRLVGITTEGPFAGIQMPTTNLMHQNLIDFYRQEFGIKGGSKNMIDHKMTCIPKNIQFEEKGDLLLLAFNGDYSRAYKDFGEIINFKIDPNETIDFAWRDECFGILVKGEENKEWLREIHTAILEKDLAIYFYGNSPYLPDGLEFAIYSKYFPQTK